MVQFVFFSLLAASLLFGLDYYVFRNWRHFARYRRWRLGWTLPAYRVLLWVMPAVLPVYFFFSRWWEVEPKLIRLLIIGLWALYYVPKVPIAAVLALKDAARGVTWLFRWFQARLASSAEAASAPAAQAEAVEAPLDLADMNRITRGEFLRRMGWTAASVPFVVVGYGVFRTLYHFEVHRVEVPVAGLPRALDGLTMAQLSDLHAGSLFSAQPMEEAVDLTLAQRPDVIVVTGDYVNSDAAETPLILPALARLRADLGVYGCLGNHDHYADVQRVAAQVRAAGLDLLVNAHRELAVDGARLYLIGTDNTGFNQRFADLPRATAGIPADAEALRVLLAHDPTFWDQQVRARFPAADLTLCGHTHGGQIGLELGPLRWGMARLVYPRWAGLYSEPRPDGTRHHLYVNRGLGTVGPPLRIGIRPEITLLTLRRA